MATPIGIAAHLWTYTTSWDISLMLLFPGWLNHFVHPFYGSGERISIAFNVLLTEIPAADKVA